MPDDTQFCPECGAAYPTRAVKGLDLPEPEPQKEVIDQTKRNDFRQFIQTSLLDVIKKVIFDPLDGTKKIISEVKNPFQIGIYCSLVCSLAIGLLFYLILPSAVKYGTNFFKFIFYFTLFNLLLSLVVTTITFIVKAISNSEKSNFVNEFLTGGIVTVGFSVFYIFIFIIYMLSPSINIFNIEGNVFGSGAFLGILFLLSFIYLIIITSNSIGQSLRSFGVKDGAAFYISPVIIILSTYITIIIWAKLFADVMSNRRY